MPSLKLFGSVLLEDQGEPARGPAARRHPLAILALLVRAPSYTLSRSKLVGRLWPEVPEGRARDRLNTHMHQLRRELGDELLASVGDEVRLEPEHLYCDVIRFEEALRAGDHRTAVELYDGPFLDGFRLKDAPGFEKWVDRERDRLRREYRDALEALAVAAEEEGGPGAAAEWWRERVEEDPYDARVTLRLMEALAAAAGPGTGGVRAGPAGTAPSKGRAAGRGG